MRVPRKGTNPNVLRCDRVAEALPHLGVLVSVAREREGPRFVRHWNPRAGQVHLDLVGRNPLVKMGVAPLRHNAVDLTRRARIDVHPLRQVEVPSSPGQRGTDHGLSMPVANSVSKSDAAVGTGILGRVQEGERRRRSTLADVLLIGRAVGVVPLARSTCPTGAPVKLQAVLVATGAPVIGLSRVPVGVGQRHAGRAPRPGALGGGVGAANPHPVAGRSGEQLRVLARVGCPSGVLGASVLPPEELDDGR